MSTIVEPNCLWHPGVICSPRTRWLGDGSSALAFAQCQQQGFQELHEPLGPSHLPSVTGLSCHLGSLTSPLYVICETCIIAGRILLSLPPPFLLILTFPPSHTSFLSFFILCFCHPLPPSLSPAPCHLLLVSLFPSLGPTEEDNVSVQVLWVPWR